ncbi:MAG TPA: prenyltransferase/squalene oxidase repeat-containing protein [Tepidisphaeraceae bacterium]|jgi:squalene-hopene/tetraprenyl-beta-curcumene cyclase|nr:prenyltransferase/squalene oxidase repeat-containing protein [Tepidisphaeraceae bacterium]
MKIQSAVILAAALAASTILAPLPVVHAAGPAPVAATAQDPATLVQSEIDKGLEYLKSQQLPDGLWEKEGEPPALTAIALRAFIGDAKYANQPFVKKGFDKLLTFQKDDGSITSDVLATYNTAIACSALALSGDPKYKAAAEKAVGYLKSIQWRDKIEGVPNQNKPVDPSDPRYGGFGYGGHSRPDMSNTQFAIEALHDAGLKPGDPAYENALKFITRDQNNSETNDQKAWAGDDGGFIYTPADGGATEVREKPGVAPDGRRMLRSYGSMTYAGLKSMIYAGLTKDDPRVKAAWKWIGNNWNLDINPGMQYGDLNDPKVAEQGLFYYYHTLARALHAYGEPIITDAKGKKHDWRVELINVLAKQQSADGHWTGVQRFMEDRPGLSTSYGVLAAEEALKDLKEHPAK